MAETQSAPSLRELSGRATPGELEWDQGDCGENFPQPYSDLYVIEEDDGVREPVIIATINQMHVFRPDQGEANALYLARLWNDYRAGRLIDPTTLSEAIASARAEGVRAGLERAAKLFEVRCTAKRGELAATATTDVRRQLDLHHEMRAAEQAASDIRDLIPAPPTTPGGRTDG